MPLVVISVDTLHALGVRCYSIPVYQGDVRGG